MSKKTIVIVLVSLVIGYALGALFTAPVLYDFGYEDGNQHSSGQYKAGYDLGYSDGRCAVITFQSRYALEQALAYANEPELHGVTPEQAEFDVQEAVERLSLVREQNGCQVDLSGALVITLDPKDLIDEVDIQINELPNDHMDKK